MYVACVLSPVHVYPSVSPCLPLLAVERRADAERASALLKAKAGSEYDKAATASDKAFGGLAPEYE